MIVIAVLMSISILAIGFPALYKFSFWNHYRVGSKVKIPDTVEEMWP